MTGKSSMIDALGERSLLLPHKLEEALAANDRLKVCFTLLQAAERHADHPEEPVPDFLVERHAAGMTFDSKRAAELAAEGHRTCLDCCHRRDRLCIRLELGNVVEQVA